MRNTLDKINEIRDRVTSVAYRLNSLANAFAATGNQSVAEKIGFMSDDLLSAIEGAGAAWNADMDEQMGHSQAMMGSILNLALNCDIKQHTDA